MTTPDVPRVKIEAGQLWVWDPAPLYELGQIWIPVCAWCKNGPLSGGATCGECGAIEVNGSDGTRTSQPARHEEPS